jgi:hypothetical protein
MSQRTLGIVVGLLLGGCGQATKPIPDAGPLLHKDLPATANRDLDLLFVIRNSASTVGYQQALGANLPALLAALTRDGALPNLHLGVATTDLGTRGALESTPGPDLGSGPGACHGDGDAGNLLTKNATGLTPGATFLSDVADASGARVRNYTGTLAGVFATIADLGDQGCGFGQHLEAAKRALNNNPHNVGFLRPAAALAVVLVGDEDDCSIAHAAMLAPTDVNGLGPLQPFRCTEFGVACDGPAGAGPRDLGPRTGCHPRDDSPYLTRVGDYGTFLKGLKADPASVVVAAIAGPPTPFEIGHWTINGADAPHLLDACTYTLPDGSGAVASPAVRLSAFVDAFAGRGLFATVCQVDLSDTLTRLGQRISEALGSPCLDAALATPYACTVADVVHQGQPSEVVTPLPACDATTSVVPCWHVVADAAACPLAADHLALVIERGGVAPAPDTHVVADCAAAR